MTKNPLPHEVLTQPLEEKFLALYTNQGACAYPLVCKGLPLPLGHKDIKRGPGLLAPALQVIPILKVGTLSL